MTHLPPQPEPASASTSRGRPRPGLIASGALHGYGAIVAPAAAMLAEIQRAAGNRATCALLQREALTVSSEEGEPGNLVWEIKGRPTFYPHVRRELVKRWNRLYPSTPLLETVNLSDEKMAQCHKMSWENIRQQIVLPFLNGEIDERRVQDWLDVLGMGMDEREGELRQLVRELAHMRDMKTMAPHVARMCRLINSCIGNLRLGDAWINSVIQSRPDLNFVATPGGQHVTASPISFGIAQHYGPQDFSSSPTEHIGKLTSTLAGSSGGYVYPRMLRPDDPLLEILFGLKPKRRSRGAGGKIPRRSYRADPSPYARPRKGPYARPSKE